MNGNSSREMEILYQNISKVVPTIADYPKTQLFEKYKEELINLERQLNRSRAELETKKFKKSKLKMTHDNNVATDSAMTLEVNKLEDKFNELKVVYKNVYGDSLNLTEFDLIIANVENDYNEEFEDFKDIQF